VLDAVVDVEGFMLTATDLTRDTMYAWFKSQVLPDSTLGVTPSQMRAVRNIVHAHVLTAKYDVTVKTFNGKLDVTIREVAEGDDRWSQSHCSWYIWSHGGVVAYEADGARLTGRDAVWCWLGGTS